MLAQERTAGLKVQCNRRQGFPESKINDFLPLLSLSNPMERCQQRFQSRPPRKSLLLETYVRSPSLQ